MIRNIKSITELDNIVCEKLLTAYFLNNISRNASRQPYDTFVHWLVQSKDELRTTPYIIFDKLRGRDVSKIIPYLYEKMGIDVSRESEVREFLLTKYKSLYLRHLEYGRKQGGV